MRNKIIILGLVSLLVLLWSSTVAAQSLGDVARQEKAKRAKQTKPPARVVTNEDFPEAPPEEPKEPASETASATGEASAAPTESAEATSSETPEPSAPVAPTEAKPEDKMKTREHWQGRFKAARQKVAAAEEVQRLVEDELSLLQIQYVRELSSEVQNELQGRIRAKQGELDARRADTAKAQQALQALEKEFKASGAPEDWSKTD